MTPRARHLRLLLFFLSISACGCGTRHPIATDTPPSALTLQLQSLNLNVQEAFPGDELSLKVLAVHTAGAAIESEHDLAPATNTLIQWKILGTPAGAPSLSQEATLTDEGGITQIVLFTGGAEAQNIQIQASATGAQPLTFTIQVHADKRRLKFLFNTPFTTAVDRTERLRVRLIRVNPDGTDGAPVPNATLIGELVGGDRNNAGFEQSTDSTLTASTNPSGIAVFPFRTGDTPLHYEIEFCGQAQCPGVGLTQANIEVGLTNTSFECVYFTDCPPGLICQNNQCITPDFYCDDDADCPEGFACNPSTRTCEGDGSVEIPPGGVIDVRGNWTTRYHFDISEALPDFFTDILGPIVDFLDVLFRSQLEIDIPILGDLLESLLDQVLAQYIPDWVESVVIFLADFIHVFENVETKGEMKLQQGTESAQASVLLNGYEDWTSALFFVPSLCEGGVSEYQSNPECGQIDLAVEPTVTIGFSNNEPVVGIGVDPFNGTLLGDALTLNDRSVHISMNQLINVLLDMVVSIASNGDYWDFEEFIVDIMPCADLQYAIDDLICDITGGDICAISGIEEFCEGAANAAMVALTELLGTFEAPLELVFDARALVHDSDNNGIAETLGSPNTPSSTTESALIGNNSLLWVFGGDLDENSWWFGVR